MNPHNNFNHWLIIDWRGKGEKKWKLDGEEVESFLLVTPDERRWIDNAQPLNLPQGGFVLIILLYPLKSLGEESLHTATLPNSSDKNLPIWCHYGGLLNFQEVEDRWRRFNWLSRSLRDKLTERLPAPYPYPIPISDSHPLPWDSGWQEARKIIRSYQPSKWNELMEKLNKVWAAAVGELSVDAAVATRNRWANAAQAIESLQALLPKEEAPTVKQLEPFLEEISSLGLSQLGPPAETGELEAELSTKFNAALDAIDTLLTNLGHAEPDGVKNYVKNIRASFQHFLNAYDE